MEKDANSANMNNETTQIDLGSKGEKKKGKKKKQRRRKRQRKGEREREKKFEIY
jgi:hypothetical protein